MKDHPARALDRINMDVLFRYRIMIKYVTIIAGVMIFFGMVYLNNREITKQSKSTYRHQQLHPHFHPRDLEVLLMRRRHQSLPLYEAGVPGVSTGMNFGFSWDHVIMKQLFKPDQKFIDLEKDYVVRPTIVMPLSTRRYEEGLDAIGSIHKYLPTEKLVIYDIGLTLRQRAHITAMCNVELIDVPFKLFPPYSRMLMRFHWKPLVMQLALSSYGAILWIESSTRFITGELSAAIEDAKKTGIKIFGLRHSYSTFSVTNPQVFKYLPSDYRRMRISGQFQTAPMIIYNTRSVCDRFMKWLVLCALERRCMSPMRATRRCYGIKKKKVPTATLR